ncbi:hypothetical protein ORV05_03670 [Amycolatopsis cynarae]|uniref:PknH-like extracellular domain-containing protein n=1 Tax=Amycolatopsis cynarae TaxID=2995223 RepID=A0ABY7B4Q0_9PSEU|nr:hypothetical protein [Amycolatopsis sp. HUAS 11-8]WAL66912.1 hypothetical protein ORV05_03670 [Amycolatopsis sp. HUAS 11-8]
MNDDETREALQTLLDEPAPPARTGLEDVVRRGRRRVLARRLGSAAAVLAVVAGVGIASTSLRATPETVQSASGGASLPGWQTVNVPAIVVIPKGDLTLGEAEKVGPVCRSSAQTSVSVEGTTLPEQTVVQAFVQAVAAAAPGAKVVQTHLFWEAPTRGMLRADITSQKSAGGIDLMADRYRGTAQQAADADAHADGNCSSPQRRTLPNGVVLQLYSPQLLKGDVQVQSLRVYGPNGRLYVLNMRSSLTGGGNVVHSGPGAFPLLEAQFAQVGTRLAELP